MQRRVFRKASMESDIAGQERTAIFDETGGL